MEAVEEFTFNIRRFMSSVGSVQNGEAERLRRWLGRNEKRFMCILEHYFTFEGGVPFIQECERDRCMVNWLKVYRYINILGIKLNITVYPVILWDIPLGGAHQVIYNAQFRYKKGWISKKETILINGEEIDKYIAKKRLKEDQYVSYRLRSEIIKLSDYIISTFFSKLMKCEGVKELMV